MKKKFFTMTATILAATMTMNLGVCSVSAAESSKPIESTIYIVGEQKMLGCDGNSSIELLDNGNYVRELVPDNSDLICNNSELFRSIYNVDKDTKGTYDFTLYHTIGGKEYNITDNGKPFEVSVKPNDQLEYTLVSENLYSKIINEIDTVIAADGKFDKVFENPISCNAYSSDDNFSDDDYAMYAKDLGKLKEKLVAMFGEVDENASYDSFYLMVSTHEEKVLGAYERFCNDYYNTSITRGNSMNLLPVLTCIDERKNDIQFIKKINIDENSITENSNNNTTASGNTEVAKNTIDISPKTADASYIYVAIPVVVLALGIVVTMKVRKKRA